MNAYKVNDKFFASKKEAFVESEKNGGFVKELQLEPMKRLKCPKIAKLIVYNIEGIPNSFSSFDSAKKHIINNQMNDATIYKSYYF